MSLDAGRLLALGAWAATCLVHGTLLMGAALLVTRRLRSLRLRERLLRAALFGGLVSASLQAGLGHEPLLGRIALPLAADRPIGELAPGSAGETARLSGAPRAARPSPVEPAAAEARRASRPTREADATHATHATDRLRAREHSRTLKTPFLAAAHGDTPSLAAGGAPADDPTLWGPTLWGPTLRDGASRWRPDLADGALALLGAWLAWIAVGHGRLLLGWLRLRRKLGGRETITGTVARDFAALRRRAGVYVPVRLTVSEDAPVPVSLGLLRREICLPRRVLDGFTRTEVRAILAHELAHVRRRDAAWFLAYALFARTFPFQPFGRRVHAELRAVAELDCDELAVRWTGAHLELASSLTEIARWLIDAPSGTGTVPSMAHERSRLGVRVVRLLEPRPVESRAEQRGLQVLAASMTLGGVSVLAPAFAASPSAPVLVARDTVATSAREVPTTAPDLRPRPVARATVPALPTALPRASTAATTPARDAADVPYGLQLDRELFTGEMQLLEDELGALRAELLELDAPHLSAAVQDIEHRMENLSLRSDRVDHLLERLFESLLSRDVGGAPRTDDPAESP